MTPRREHFVEQVKREAGSTDRPVVLICRSGKRTVEAGQALEAAGFGEVVNVLHGFEGELDANFQRGRVSGWRHAGLPWEQL
jgi:rhodanese-related sulfurtransferase